MSGRSGSLVAHHAGVRVAAVQSLARPFLSRPAKFEHETLYWVLSDVEGFEARNISNDKRIQCSKQPRFGPPARRMVRQRLPLLGIHNRRHAAESSGPHSSRQPAFAQPRQDLFAGNHLAQLSRLWVGHDICYFSARMIRCSVPWHGKREWNIQGAVSRITRNQRKRFSKMIGIERSTWSSPLA